MAHTPRSQSKGGMFDFFKQWRKRDSLTDGLPSESKKRIKKRLKEIDKILNSPSQPAEKKDPHPIPTHIQNAIEEKFFKLAAGGGASVERMFIQISGYGCFGDVIITRELALGRMPATVERMFGHSAFYVIKPPPGPLPLYTFLAEFQSGPIDKKNDFSRLVAVWFEDKFPDNLRSIVAEKISTAPWTKHALDGEY